MTTLSTRLFCLPWRRLTLLLLAAALAGCGTLETRESASVRAFRPNIAIHGWDLRGKIGVKTREQASSGYLNWHQCERQFEIRVNGPLGSGAAKLVGGPGRVTLYQGGEPPRSAPSAEQLIEQQLGWPLPVTHLRYWILGLPDPGAHYRGNPQGFTQSGWSLTFPRQTEVDGYTLPARAVATSGNSRVTLVFQQWQLLSECTPDQ